MGMNSSVKTISLLMTEHSDGGVNEIFGSVQTSDSPPERTSTSWALPVGQGPAKMKAASL